MAGCDARDSANTSTWILCPLQDRATGGELAARRGKFAGFDAELPRPHPPEYTRRERGSVCGFHEWLPKRLHAISWRVYKLLGETLGRKKVVGRADRQLSHGVFFHTVE